MSNPNNYGPLMDLVNSNTEKIRAAYNQQRKLYEQTQAMVVAQNAKITSLAAQLAALQQKVVMASVNVGSGATVV